MSRDTVDVTKLQPGEGVWFKRPRSWGGAEARGAERALNNMRRQDKLRGRVRVWLNKDRVEVECSDDS